jgi:hypothetical protein
MTSPLHSTLDEFRRRLRRLLVLRGSARLLTIVILSTLLACCADAWCHLDPVAARVSLLALIALGTLAGGVVLLVYPWLRTIPDAELAREIERSRGAARDSLISSVDFDGRECSADRGSPRLQRAVVEEQARRLSATAVSDFVDTRPVQRAVVWALTACVLAAGTLLADRPRASLALHRLFVPFSAPAWPREHALRLLDDDFQPLSPTEPVIVAVGREPTLYVEDIRGRLPEQIVLQVWQDDELLEQQLQTREIAVDNQGTQTRRLAAFSIPAHEGESWLRAIGGDDDRMPWHFTRRIAPPAIAELNLKVRPPAYTSRPVVSLSGHPGPLETLVGSVVEMELTPSKPLQEVVLRRDGQPDQPLQADERAQGRYTIAWEVSATGRTPFWFELLDRYGLQNFPVTRYEVLAVEDREPVVSIEHPPTGATLTPLAVVPFRCVAEDDVGLSQVQLQYSDPPGSEGTQLYPLPAIEENALRVDLQTTLAMPDLHAQPGARILFRAEAIDGYNLGPAHVGRSARHTVLIITPEEKLHELLNREIGIAETLERVIAMQADAAEQTRQLRLQWRHTSQFRPQDQDLLSRVIHDNSRMEAELYDERRGAESRVDVIRDELEWNRIENEAIQARLDLIFAELQRLKTESIPLLQRSLATARKSSSMPGDRQRPLVEEALASAESMQVDITETLRMLLGMLRGWRERYDLLRALGEISDDQEQLTTETTAFGQPLLERESLGEQDEADFARLADRQQILAERLAELAENADRSAAGEGGAEADRDSLLRLADALRESRAADTMQRAAELLRNHNVGEAMTTQAELVEALRSLTETLDRWQPADAETLLKQVERAEAELESLHGRQDAARQRTAAMAADGATPDELQQLRREQRELAEQTADSALRLLNHNSPGAAAGSSRAADAMRAAAERLQDEVSDPVLRQQQQALDELQHARQELAQLRQTLELRFALQQAGEMSATLESCRDRQRELLNQALDLHHALEEAGRLRRSQLSALNDLKRTQSELAADVTSLAGEMEGMPAFRIVLTAAIDAMHLAGERLTPDLLHEATQYQTTAAQRLTEIIDALAGGGRAAPPTTPSGEAGQGDQRGLVDWTLIAQIRLLRGMQSQIAGRIAELTQATSVDAALTDEQQRELDELVSLQGQAAQVAADLMEAAVGDLDTADSALEEAVP